MRISKDAYFKTRHQNQRHSMSTLSFDEDETLLPANSDQEHARTRYSEEETSPTIFRSKSIRQHVLPPPAFAKMDNCESCRQEFSVLFVPSDTNLKRHHCRNCGGSFCEDCSSKCAIVPYEDCIRKGKQRVCENCFTRIQEFQRQIGSTHVTWGGFVPCSTDQFLDEFQLTCSQVPIVVYSCCYFPDYKPYYGHLFLTQDYMCFRTFKKNKDMNVQVHLDSITSANKPEFYLLNAVQICTSQTKIFFAEFNGQRDICFLRMNQIMEQRKVRRRIKSASNSGHFSQKELKQLGKERSKKLFDIHDVDNICSSPDEADVIIPAPDTIVAGMNIILECEFLRDVSSTFDLFWSNELGKKFYYDVLRSANAIDIELGEWKPMESSIEAKFSTRNFLSSEKFSHYRFMSAKHPPKFSFPGLPKYADCHRIQRYRKEGDGNCNRIIVSDLLEMEKIPYADNFEIEHRWVFSQDGTKLCHVEVGLQLHFLKSTWFKTQIESSSLSESKDFMQIWLQRANEQLKPSTTSKSNEIVSPQPTQQLPILEVSPTDSPTIAVPDVAKQSESQVSIKISKMLICLLFVMFCLYILWSLYNIQTSLGVLAQKIEVLEVTTSQLQTNYCQANIQPK